MLDVFSDSFVSDGIINKTYHEKDTPSNDGHYGCIFDEPIVKEFQQCQAEQERCEGCPYISKQCAFVGEQCSFLC